MSGDNIEDVAAADAYRQTLLVRADGHNPSPFWYGWVIMEAYLAGLKVGREESAAIAEGPFIGQPHTRYSQGRIDAANEIARKIRARNGEKVKRKRRLG